MFWNGNSEEFSVTYNLNPKSVFWFVSTVSHKNSRIANMYDSISHSFLNKFINGSCEQIYPNRMQECCCRSSNQSSDSLGLTSGCAGLIKCEICFKVFPIFYSISLFYCVKHRIDTWHDIFSCLSIRGPKEGRLG